MSDEPEPVDMLEPDYCDAFDHDWGDHYYGYQCKKCGMFVAFGCEPWAPLDGIGYDDDDEDDDWDDDYGPIVTNEGTCSNCLYKIPLDDLKMLDFDVEESGVQPGTVHGPTVYWAAGTIGCPSCGVRLPFETSSD